MSNIKPTLTWNTVFQPGAANKLSYVAPYNQCTVEFSCNKPYQKFMCRSTFEDEDWSPDDGVLIQEYTNRDADVKLSFIIDATQHLIHNGIQESGMYRIGLYVQDTDGKWNLDAYFFVNTGAAFYVVDSSSGTDIPFAAEYK